MDITIALGADHGGFNLKNFLKAELLSRNISVIDAGVNSPESVDYPDIAKVVARSVLNGEANFGVLVCGSGVGMSIAANRHPHIRAALCHDEYSARFSRLHNDANILCLGERVIGTGKALSIMDIWLSTPFEKGRHLKRVEKIEDFMS